jgi:hypothetical protein
MVEMSLIDVNVEGGHTMIARIIEKQKGGYLVHFLEETHQEGVFKFDTVNPVFVENETVSGFYDTDDLSVAGYVDLGSGKYTLDDSEYEPSSSEEDEESDDESLVDEDGD